MLTPITSTRNPEVRRLCTLATAAGRREQGTFLVEGLRAIDGFLAAGWIPRQAFFVDTGEAPPHWSPLWARPVASLVAHKLSGQKTPSGFAAEFAIPVPAELDERHGGLVCAGVADPGNLGTLLRSAAAFGVEQVLLVGGADPFAPKVVQASAGALASLRLRRVDSIRLGLGGSARAPIVGLVVDGGELLGAQPRWPVWLAVGGEAHGLDSEALACCDHRFTLPMPGAAIESLNAGVAGALALFLLRGLHRDSLAGA
ncbi:MAG: TrmH family RNA methyltransferase [Planctomycetota bacterium]